MTKAKFWILVKLKDERSCSRCPCLEGIVCNYYGRLTEIGIRLQECKDIKKEQKERNGKKI